MSIITPSGKIITPDALFVKHRYARNSAEIDNAPMQMEGLFKFIVRRADGSIKQETPFSRNLILNQGLNFFGSTAQYVSFCGVGTSTSPPTATDTALLAGPIYTTTLQASVDTGSGGAPWYVATSRTFRFALGQLNGNYTEVGVGATQPALFSRALITPDGVNPTALPVQSDEQLDVVYQLRYYAPASDVTGSITLAGQSYSFTGRAAYVGVFGVSSGGFGNVLFGASWGNLAFGARPFSGSSENYVYAGNIGPVTGEPVGTRATSGTEHVTNSYSAGSYQRSGRINYGLNDGNLAGGIRSMLVHVAGGGLYQYEFTPNIPKDNTKTLGIDAQVSWARRP